MTKDRILEVASKEFAKYGYDAVSMNNLVKKLDINKATVYYHYKDKRTLYIEVMKSIIIFTNERVKLIFNENKDGKQLLKDYIKAQVECIKEKPTIPALALRETANLGADVDNSISLLLEEEVLSLEKILSKLSLKDEFKNINPYAFHSMINGTIFNFYAIQMTDLEIGTNDKMKKDPIKSLDYIADFTFNVLSSSICKS